MRLAFLTSVFSYGGAQMSSVELAVRLGSCHDVKFFDTNGSSEPFINSLIKNKIEYSLPSKSIEAFIIKRYNFKLRNVFRYFIYFFKWNKIRSRVHADLAHYRPDIVTVYDDRSLSYLLGIKNRSFKILYYARGWYTPDQISFIMRFLLKNLADILICISEATRQALYCGGIAPMEKMFVIHNSVNKAKLYSNLKPIDGYDNHFKIIHSGGFLPSKGQHVALAAANLLKERIDNFHLFLCGIVYPGQGEESLRYLDELKDFIETSKLESFVSFVIGKSNIISYIDYCDIMFFPSSSEGLPRSVMEAMALGKPVIANAAGGITDLILDRYTGFITKYNDPSEYADIAEQLYKDDSLYKEISNNASNLIESSFSDAIQLKKTEEILQFSKSLKLKKNK
jgi:L-malate glycosyltransferase